MKNNDDFDDIDDYMSQFMLPKRKKDKSIVDTQTNEENDNIDDFLNQSSKK